MQPYERTLRLTLEHPALLAVFSVLLIGASYVCYSRLGSDLLPQMDEGGFILDYLMPAGSSLEETNRVVKDVERILRATPEVESTSRRTGLQLGLATVTEANRGDIAIKLKRDRKRGVEEVIADVREKVTKQEPMLQVEFPQLLQDMIGDLITSSPEPSPLNSSVRIRQFCGNGRLRSATPSRRFKGVVDVLNGIDDTISGPATLFQVDPAVAARAGFTPQEIELDASAIMQGEPATAPVVVNDRAYTIRVRFPPETRSSVEAIRNTLLVSSTGKTRDARLSRERLEELRAKPRSGARTCCGM